VYVFLCVHTSTYLLGLLIYLSVSRSVCLSMGMAASFLYLPCCLCRPTCCCPSIPVSVCLLFCLSVRARACVFVYLSIATSPTRALCLIGQRSSHRRGLSHTAGGSVLAIIRSAQARWERARCLGALSGCLSLK